MIIPSHNAILCFSKGATRPLPGLLGPRILTDEIRGVAPTVEFLCNRSRCLAERIARGRSDKTEFSDLWYDIHRLFALFTEPEELVLDCFNGAGTSTLVAHQMGRGFVGIEVSEYYHRLASERHKMIEHGDDPFAKRN